MRTNWVKERLKDGQPTVGCFLGMGSPRVAEQMAHAGFDFAVIEMEHTAIDFNDVEHMLMAMSGTKVIPLVRLPSSDQVFIQRALDAGGMGVVVPLVKTAAEAEAIVKATRYPPHGIRGFGPLRASNFTLDYPDYIARADENMLVALLLETKEAIDDLEAITATGIDALYLGLWDLCMSYGLNPINMPFPEIDAAIDRAIEVCRSAGVALGIGSGTPDELLSWKKRGLTFLGYGPDFILLANAARAGVEAFKNS